MNKPEPCNNLIPHTSFPVKPYTSLSGKLNFIVAANVPVLCSMPIKNNFNKRGSLWHLINYRNNLAEFVWIFLFISLFSLFNIKAFDYEAV